MHSHIVLHAGELRLWLASHSRAHLDIGCGDGSAALAYARKRPDTAVLGIDTCLDNLNRKLRRAPDNLRFLRGDATRPLVELESQFDSGTIAFPFGSLLRGLLGGDSAVLDQILSPFKHEASVRVWINESAIQATVGSEPDMPSALDSLQDALGGKSAAALDHRDIRYESSRWAKRIGYGKPSRTWLITGRKRVCAHGPAIGHHVLPRTLV